MESEKYCFKRNEIEIFKESKGIYNQWQNDPHPLSVIQCWLQIYLLILDQHYLKLLFHSCLNIE